MSLSAQLGGQARQRPTSDREPTASPRPAGAYLRSLTVGGFRGIGKPATLSLTPGPGLTLVVGRNGSGKSSFAEALEVLLTSELRRWEKLSAVWREGWRSMHQPDQAEITADFLVAGAGPAEVGRTWPKGAGFTESSASVLVAGEKRTGLNRLDWSKALADYRPFLSHSELEAFFGSPSGLYELLASVLRLEDLTRLPRFGSTPQKQESALSDAAGEELLDRACWSRPTMAGGASARSASGPDLLLGRPRSVPG